MCVFEIIFSPDFVLSKLDLPRTIMHHPDIRTLFLKRSPKRFTVFEMLANGLFTWTNNHSVGERGEGGGVICGADKIPIGIVMWWN
jgi:hypothetical protein